MPPEHLSRAVDPSPFRWVGIMALGWAYQSFDGTEVARVQRARSITFSIC
jgi:hypothetical protein